MTVAGTPETVAVDNLTPDTTHWFAMVVLDEVGNASALSNTAVETTGATPGGEGLAGRSSPRTPLCLSQERVHIERMSQRAPLRTRPLHPTFTAP